MAQAPSQQIAFAVMDEPATRGTVAVHVNFGVYTGREATLAEIDRLAASLLERVATADLADDRRAWLAAQIDALSAHAAIAGGADVPYVERVERFVAT